MPAGGGRPMKCPFCGHTEDRVVDSRVGRDGEFIRRRRECLKCHRRYTTYEYIEDVLPHVDKRDGRREPFDRQKLRDSILKACEKRSVAVTGVDDIVAEIEAAAARARREGDQVGRARRDGHGAAAEARPGRLRALLVRVPAVPGRRRSSPTRWPSSRGCSRTTSPSRSACRRARGRCPRRSSRGVQAGRVTR